MLGQMVTAIPRMKWIFVLATVFIAMTSAARQSGKGNDLKPGELEEFSQTFVKTCASKSVGNSR
jgi:hypothetical protein